MTPIFTMQDTTTFAGFFQQGLLENNKEELIQKNSANGQTYFALVENLNFYAPTVAAMANAVLENLNDETLNGPIEYEVCEGFGRWYGQCVLGDEDCADVGGEPSRAQALDYLRELVAHYFFEIYHEADKRQAIVSGLADVSFVSFEELYERLHKPAITVEAATKTEIREHVKWLRDNFGDGEAEMRIADKLEALTHHYPKPVIDGDLKIICNAMVNYIDGGSDTVNGDHLFNSIFDFVADRPLAGIAKHSLSNLEHRLGDYASPVGEQGERELEGFALAFLDANDAEAEELIASLKVGGNNVVRVSDNRIEQAALAVATGDILLEAEELSPSVKEF